MLIEFEPPAFFDDCQGNPRFIATCSIIGRQVFRRLYNQLIHLLSQFPEVPWEGFVEKPAVRPILAEVLDLNGLDINRLSPNQLQSLLISRHDAEACIHLPGYLVELNEIPRNTEGPEPVPIEIIDPPFSISPPRLFPLVMAEFVDRKGTVRPIYALSFAAYREFYERLTFIKEAASGEFTQTWQEMFETQIPFRYSCCRCLELNGISPDWVTFSQLEQLLIKRYEEGQKREGWLLTLNRIPPAPEQIESNESDSPGAVESIIASLYLQGVPLTDAFGLMNCVPANLLSLTLRQYSEMIKNSALAKPLPTPPRSNFRISYEEAERTLNQTDSKWTEVDIDV